MEKLPKHHHGHGTPPPNNPRVSRAKMRQQKVPPFSVPDIHADHDHILPRPRLGQALARAGRPTLPVKAARPSQVPQRIPIFLTPPPPPPPPAPPCGTAADAADTRVLIGAALGLLDGHFCSPVKDAPACSDAGDEVTRAGSRLLASRGKPVHPQGDAGHRQGSCCGRGGQCIVVKTNLTEFAYSASGANPPLSARREKSGRDAQCTGGSSSGAAMSVAVADGIGDGYRDPGPTPRLGAHSSEFLCGGNIGFS